MREPKYGPLPWRLERDRGAETIIAADGGVMFSDDSQDTIGDVAEYIVHCVNCHADLLAVCAALLDADEEADTWPELERLLQDKIIPLASAAIAKARP